MVAPQSDPINVQQQTQNPTPPANPEGMQPAPDENQSILDRVSNFVADNQEQVNTIIENDDGQQFNSEEISQLTQDPKILDFFNKQRQSYDRAYGKKFEEISQLTKDLKSVGNPQSASWTPERIQAEMSKPDFINAAQSVLGTSSPTESGDGSLMTEAEKRKMAELEQQVNQLRTQTTTQHRQQEHNQLQTKYASYDSQAVDTLFYDYLNGKPQATNEDLWKVLDYEAAVQRGYQVGLKDGQNGVREKINSVSNPNTINVNRNNPVPNREEGESSENYFVRIGKQKLAGLMGK